MAEQDGFTEQETLLATYGQLLERKGYQLKIQVSRPEEDYFRPSSLIRREVPIWQIDVFPTTFFRLGWSFSVQSSKPAEVMATAIAAIEARFPRFKPRSKGD